MNAHSPSPWHAGGIDEDADVIYDVDDNPIAYADHSGFKPTDKTLEIDAANARLIAAAPELAQAAGEALQLLIALGLANAPTAPQMLAEYPQVLAVRAALAKAGL
jgi:hypothetical protein